MVKYDEKGLAPAVVQDASSGEVLMLGYVNDVALQKTFETGKACFYSRSRQELWLKGETSGNFLNIKSVRIDCDKDAIIYLAEPMGPTCHTNERSCFYRILNAGGEMVMDTDIPSFSCDGADILDEVFAVIKDRQEKMPEGSYTVSLLREGVDKIGKKIGEESAEVIIAGKNGKPARIAEEVADLLYHTMVMLAATGVSLEDVRKELRERRK